MKKTDKDNLIKSHVLQEIYLLKIKFPVLLLCFIFQYFHLVSTNVAYFLHIPREPLWDLGFALLPITTNYMNRCFYYLIIIFTFFFMLSPFYYTSTYYKSSKQKNNTSILSNNSNKMLKWLLAKSPANKYHSYTLIMLTRFACTGVLAQCLRIITFLVTTLPGPSAHCRPDSPYYNPPTTLSDILFHRTSFMNGCGDLVFSSHCLLVVLCSLTYSHYGRSHLIKALLWSATFLHGITLVASREHYMLDVFIAWYTVPLVWVAYETYFPDKIPELFAAHAIHPNWHKRHSSIDYHDLQHIPMLTPSSTTISNSSTHILSNREGSPSILNEEKESISLSTLQMLINSEDTNTNNPTSLERNLSNITEESL